MQEEMKLGLTNNHSIILLLNKVQISSKSPNIQELKNNDNAFKKRDSIAESHKNVLSCLIYVVFRTFVRGLEYQLHTKFSHHPIFA